MSVSEQAWDESACQADTLEDLIGGYIDWNHDDLPNGLKRIYELQVALSSLSSFFNEDDSDEFSNIAEATIGLVRSIQKSKAKLISLKSRGD